MPKLIIQHEGSEHEVQLKPGSNTLGRQSTNTVPLKDATLSRLHCEILLEGGQATLVDKGSRNGTLLNGKKITSQVLRAGDKIAIGATVLWFEQKAVATVASVPLPPPAAPAEDVTPPAPAPATRRAAVAPPAPVPAADAPSAASPVADYGAWTRPGIPAGKVASLLVAVLLAGGAAFGAWKIVSAPPPPAPDLDNLVARNGGFSSVTSGRPDGWVLRPGASDRVSGSISVDPARGRNGGNCLVVDKSASSGELLAEVAWQEDLSLARGASVEASAWTQFEGFTGWVALKIEWLKSPKGAVLSEEYSDAASKSSGWTSFGGAFHAPPGAGAFRVALAVLGRTGRAAFDDVSVKVRPGAGGAGGGEKRLGGHRVVHTKAGVLQIELRGGRRAILNLGARLESEKEGGTPQGLATEVSASPEEAGLLFQGRLANPLDFREIPFEQRVASVEGHTAVVYQFRGDALKQTDRFSIVMTLPRTDSIRGLPEGGETVTSRVTCSTEDGDFAIEYLDPARVAVKSVDGRARLIQTWSVDPQSEDPSFGLRIRESGAGTGPLDPLQRIAELRKDRKPGEALAFIRETAGKTKEAPVREKMDSERAQLEETLKREWADLQADAFRARISRQEALVTRVLDQIDRFAREWAGEGTEGRAAQLRQDLQKDLAAVPDPASERAKRILERAKQSSAAGRRTLAQVLLQTLAARYPSSEAAREAQQLLKTLNSP